MPIWMSPELKDSGVGKRTGTGLGAAVISPEAAVLGLGSGVGRAPSLTPMRYGWRPFLCGASGLVRYISSLDIRLLSTIPCKGMPERPPAILSAAGPEEVLGLAGMTMDADGNWFRGVLGGGGGGS